VKEEPTCFVNDISARDKLLARFDDMSILKRFPLVLTAMFT
jgi:hypothetical protein